MAPAAIDAGYHQHSRERAGYGRRSARLDFPQQATASGHIEQMSAAFSRCVKRAGLDTKTVTPHVMRHTAITRLAVTGADIKTIQEFSGHESLQMVLRYAHAQDRAVDRALDRMEGAEVVEHSANLTAQKS